MIFKQKSLLIALLLSIVIIFAFLGAMQHSKMTVEGMESKTTKDVPLCSNSNVPGCYSNVMDLSVWEGTEDLGNDYILKTEIVPPVCPACPSVINQHSHDGELTSENEKIGGSTYEESNITNITNQENIINQSVENVNTDVQSGPIEDTQDSEEQPQPQQQPQQDGLFTTSSGQNTITETMLSSYEKTISDLKGQIKQLQQTNSPRKQTENGECPPCPAPSRCPEPAFSCQKVINYRSPSAGQYLPMPVLNDFSTFKQN